MLLCCAGEVVDEQTAQEETEDKLKQCIDNLMDKRYPTHTFKMHILYITDCKKYKTWSHE